MHQNLVQTVLGFPGLPTLVPRAGNLPTRTPSGKAWPVPAWAKPVLARQIPSLAGVDAAAADAAAANAAHEAGAGEETGAEAPIVANAANHLPSGAPGRPETAGSTGTEVIQVVPDQVQSLMAQQTRVGQGINCLGSSRCWAKGKDVISLIQGDMNATVKDEDIFTNGQHIVCQIHFCAFLQRCSRNYTGLEVKSLANDLATKGCGTCGSAPVAGLGSDVGYGMLTVNYVDHLP